MRLLLSERTALLIDGMSIYNTSRNLGIDIDYREFLEFFNDEANIVRANYYSTIVESEDYTPIKPLTDWLSYNGYCVVSKTAREFTDNNGRRRVKGDMNVEIVVDMLELAPRIDHLILVTGDACFRKAVEAVQRQSVRVTVISSLRSTPPTISDELRRQADTFVELAEIADNFTRKTDNRRDQDKPYPPVTP